MRIAENIYHNKIVYKIAEIYHIKLPILLQISDGSNQDNSWCCDGMKNMEFVNIISE